MQMIDGTKFHGTMDRPAFASHSGIPDGPRPANMDLKRLQPTQYQSVALSLGLERTVKTNKSVKNTAFRAIAKTV